MSTTMTRTLLFAALLLVIGCGGGIRDELSMVPGTCLFHVHLEKGISPAVLNELVSLDRNLVLAESLLARGPVGVTLMGVDITSLSPQFLFLTRRVSPDRAADLAAEMLNLSRTEDGSRINLADRTGLIRASVTGRKGWTAIYLGPAANITADAWLRMEKVGSLAADEALLQALPGRHHATLMLPGNLFAFVSLLPVERYIPWWEEYTRISRLVRPSAMTLSVTWPSSGRIVLEAIMAREDGGVTSARFSIDDTGVSPDSVFALLSGLAGGLL